MKNVKITFIALVLFNSLFSISCTYNESPVYSSAYTETYFRTILISEWQKVEDGHWFVRLNIPNIKLPVVNNGTVLVYFKDNNKNWVALPYSTIFYNLQYNQQFTEEIWAGYALGTLDIDYVYTNPSDMTPRNLELKILLLKLEEFK